MGVHLRSLALHSGSSWELDPMGLPQADQIEGTGRVQEATETQSPEKERGWLVWEKVGTAAVARAQVNLNSYEIL